MSSNMWEGLGGPVRMDQPDLSGIDPTLDSCCRREVSSYDDDGAPTCIFYTMQHFLIFLST
jgi:hypothetical protein